MLTHSTGDNGQLLLLGQMASLCLNYLLQELMIPPVSVNIGGACKLNTHYTGKYIMWLQQNRQKGTWLWVFIKPWKPLGACSNKHTNKVNNCYKKLRTDMLYMKSIGTKKRDGRPYAPWPTGSYMSPSPFVTLSPEQRTLTIDLCQSAWHLCWLVTTLSQMLP